MAMYDATMEYGFNDNMTELPLELDRIFIGIRAQLDANTYKWEKRVKQGEHGIKGAAHGSKGGRPRKKKAKNEASDPSNIDDFVLTDEMQEAMDKELKSMQETPLM